MGVSMSTLFGWVAVLSVFGGYSFREWSKKHQLQLARAEAHRLRQERHNASLRREQKEIKARRSPTETIVSKPKSSSTAPAPAQHTVKYRYSSDDDDAAAQNREFARQLSNVKQGTKFTGKTKDEQRQKSVKQSRAEEPRAVADGGLTSAASSTAGIDADDDRSSAAASPVFAPTDAGYVDDMLEKPTNGPTVLRLTGTDEKKPGNTANAKKATATSQPAETKKQRQNRKKAEQAKAIREEEEKDRKIKQEAQRRLARLAENRAAKDGSAFMAAQSSKQKNAWNGNAASATNGFVPSQPLDTFDANAVKPAASKSPAPSFDKSEDWMSSLPSEEEQMELLRKEEDDAWSTVKTKSRKTKTSKEAGLTNGSPTSTAAATAAPASSLVAATAVKKPLPSKPTVASGFSSGILNVDGADNDEEEEWDV